MKCKVIKPKTIVENNQSVIANLKKRKTTFTSLIKNKRVSIGALNTKKIIQTQTNQKINVKKN